MDCWKVLDAVSLVVPRILLSGPPGTGKTTWAVRTAHKDAFSVTLTGDPSDAVELRGHYLPTGDGFKWHDGPAIKAWRQGARLVINEIDKGAGEALTLLYAILDDAEIACLTLPSGETVQPHKDFTCVCTMNGDPRELPPALLDRFDVRVHIDAPHPELLHRLPRSLRAGVAADPTSLSVRCWLSFIRLLNSGVDNDTAAKAVFGERAEEAIHAFKLATAE